MNTLLRFLITRERTTNVCIAPFLEHRSLLQRVQKFMVFGFRLAVFNPFFVFLCFKVSSFLPSSRASREMPRSLSLAHKTTQSACYAV